MLIVLFSFRLWPGPQANPWKGGKTMREYELYLIIDATADEEAVASIRDRVAQLISTSHSGEVGEVIKVESRGKRRLTFPIKRQVESQDLVVTFHTPQQALRELERVLKLDEQVLRYLIVRKDED
jgi:small subunit ribosomal protein S6